ncbi:hypothetical protein niasHT_011948 [Heterodera trifolii]|uniref:Uncharacterized protein n=1 Tax=Heterodera trifolii TaxID=157864 RepID=A0ABD2KY71_9BILA
MSPMKCHSHYPYAEHLSRSTARYPPIRPNPITPQQFPPPSNRSFAFSNIAIKQCVCTNREDRQQNDGDGNNRLLPVAIPRHRWCQILSSISSAYSSPAHPTSSQMLNHSLYHIQRRRRDLFDVEGNN